MNEQPTHDSVLAELVGVLAELVGLLKDPAALAKKITELGVATTAQKAAAASTRTEQQKLADLQVTVENGVAVMREKADQELSAAGAAHDRKCTEREAALTAREKRATELEAKAVEHEAKAKTIRTAIEKKQRAWDAA